MRRGAEIPGIASVSFSFANLDRGTSLGGVRDLVGCSVLIATASQLTTTLALIECTLQTPERHIMKAIFVLRIRHLLKCFNEREHRRGWRSKWKALSRSRTSAG
jgi:hypothetical protein